jgi:hypothetical protein
MRKTGGKLRSLRESSERQLSLSTQARDFAMARKYAGTMILSSEFLLCKGDRWLATINEEQELFSKDQPPALTFYPEGGAVSCQARKPAPAGARVDLPSEVGVEVSGK